jgi:hypothetical protein
MATHLFRPAVAVVTWVTLFVIVPAGGAQEAVRLQEVLQPGAQYVVSGRVELSGALTLPLEKGQTTPKTLAVSGNSALDYHERLLTIGKDGQVQSTLRVYKRLEFQRKVGDQSQQSKLRAEVQRLVITRHNQLEVPFSPDGPLTWNELDLIRTDVFTPALTGLLPTQPVRPGDKWNASTVAVQELTDLEKIDQGGLSCKLDQVTLINQRRHARISFSGSVRGLGEDGPTSHQLDGYFFFDLESNHISYISMRGVQQLLDKDGKTVGKIEGTFVLTRRPEAHKGLGDDVVRALTLEPNADNTALLYDNAELGVRFLHPRSWRIAGVRGSQIALDENGGSGMLLTLEPLKQTPTAAQFLQESQTYLQKEKVKILRTEPQKQIQGPPQAVDQFALEIEIGKDRVVMGYWVLRQNAGGATVAARIVQQDVGRVWEDVRRIVRSVQIFAPQK